MAKAFKVKQVKSTNGKPQRQRDGIRCLGLRGIGSEVTVADNPAMRGQIFKLQHMLKVTPVE